MLDDVPHTRALGRSHDRAVPFAQLQRQRGQQVQALHAKPSRVEEDDPLIVEVGGDLQAHRKVRP